MESPAHIHQLTDHLFRREAGKMISVLTRIFGAENLELAEDVVQDTFIVAINTWPFKGIPESPSSWLYRVAKNKALDIVRRNRFSQQIDFADPDRALLASEYTLSVTMDALWKDASIQDDQLRMMFACCHPGIHAESQISLMLKTLCGFSVAEIARAFLTSEETISKRLYRTKEFFRTHKVRPEFPQASQLRSRTEAVLRTIYLLFNEGYNATHADELIRKDLLDQAIYLCGLLCGNPNANIPESYAAMALMCFHLARIDSRTNHEGDIILLADQDRSRWNADLIQKGTEYLNKAAVGESVSSYHIEAAIACEHCMAHSFEETNWTRILQCYDWLMQVQPTSVVALNRLMVVFKAQGKDAALSEIEKSIYRTEWEKNYLFHSLLGELLSETDNDAAAHAFERAIDLTQSKAEQKLLRRKLDELKQRIL